MISDPPEDEVPVMVTAAPVDYLEKLRKSLDQAGNSLAAVTTIAYNACHRAIDYPGCTRSRR
jgi:hypothetical protein